MRRDILDDLRRADGGPEGIAQPLLVDRVGAVAVGKQPARVAMGSPKAAQIVQKRWRQRYKPLLVAFAGNAQQQVGAVDRADLQDHGLADAQTAGIPQGSPHFLSV